jgi:hypothetical protein
MLFDNAVAIYIWAQVSVTENLCHRISALQHIQKDQQGFELVLRKVVLGFTCRVDTSDETNSDTAKILPLDMSPGDIEVSSELDLTVTSDHGVVAYV